MPSSDLVALALLCFINLINYMDRFTIAGVLDQIQEYYGLNEKNAGLLQTSFVISYMICAPVFGYLGDRYSRKYIMCIGVLFWSATTYFGSMVPRDYWGLFFLFRGLVGVGEASYSTIAPTLIADLFSREKRSKCLAIFYFAIPVGSGLGYVVGSSTAKIFGAWYWALRVTPILGIIAVVLTLLFLREPQRGLSDGVTEKVESDLCSDIKYLTSVKSYLWSTLGFTCVCFAIGALSWFAPKYMINAIAVYRREDTPTDKLKQEVNLIFGAITCVGGIAGVLIGVTVSQWYKKYNLRADPIICATGVLLAVPFAFIGLVVAHLVPILTWFFIFIAVTLLCVNWSLVADMLLYVVVPHRRAFAQAVQILTSHLFGDASSPYIVGAISDAFQKNNSTTVVYYSLQYGMYSTTFVLVLGGLAFLYTTSFIVTDQQNCNNEMEVSKLPKEETIMGEKDESLQIQVCND